MSLTERCKTLW